MQIEIYVAGHKDSACIPGEPFIPIHVGRAGKNTTFCDVGDDTGDNISTKNDTFCELTALYWIWKNTSGQDYVGIFHYRRHMNLSPVETKENEWGMSEYEAIDEKYLAINQLNLSGAKSFLEGYDLVLPHKWDVRNSGSKSMYDHFDKGADHNISDYDLALEILTRRHPSYAAFARKVNIGKSGYFTNMFIMRRNIFDEYCEWLFDILFELEKEIDVSNYSVQERRILGFISEWLFNIYIEKLIFDHPELKVRTTQRTFIRDTSPKPTPSPFYSSNYTAVVMAFKDGFTPYAGTTLRSMADASNPDHNYDIIVFDGGISDRNRKLISYTLKSFANFHIRFIDPQALFSSLSLPTHLHISKDTYYRLLIPEIFSRYERIIYLDGDMIVRKDISLLDAVPLENKSIAAVGDYIMTGFRKFRQIALPYELEAEAYLKEKLGLRDVSCYFQAGLVVFNISKAKEKIPEIKSILASGNLYWFMDQDILNMIYQEDVEYLDPRWNVFHGNGNTETFFERLPAKARNEYFKSRENPFILHYAGENKPWSVPDVDFAEEFWAVARETPWYEAMVVSLVKRKKRRGLVTLHTVRAIVAPFAPIGSRRRWALRRVYYYIRRIYGSVKRM